MCSQSMSFHALAGFLSLLVYGASGAFGQTGSIFSSEFLCVGLACDHIKCTSDADCPPFHTCTGFTKKFWKNGTGFLGAAGLGLDAALKQPLRGSGGILTAGPAAVSGMIDGIFSSLAPDLKPPIQTLLSPNYCEPTKLKQPSNIVTPGGYFVTPDMNAWVPLGPERVVSLPHSSRRGRMYMPPSLTDPLVNPLPILGKLLESNSSGTHEPEALPKSPPKVSVNGDLINYDYETNELGETVLAAHSVYESRQSKELNDTRDASTSRDTSLDDESAAQHESGSARKGIRPTGITGILSLAPEHQQVNEEDGTGLNARSEPLHGKDEVKRKSSENVDVVTDGRPPSAETTERLTKFLQALSMLSASKLRAIMESASEETVGRPLKAEEGKTGRRLAPEVAREAGQAVENAVKTEENIDKLLTLGITAAAKLETLLPMPPKIEVQSPVQYGLNVLNSKADVQIECRTPVVRTYTPFGAVILSLKNKSFSPSVIRNDLFTAYIQENVGNRRLPIVSVVDASTFRDVERDYVLLVCGRPGRFVSYFLVGITFVFGDKKQATNICPVEFFCEKGSEVPADEIALYFKTIPKKPLLPNSDQRQVPVGYVNYIQTDEFPQDDYEVPTPARNRFPGNFALLKEKEMVEEESFAEFNQKDGEQGLEEFWLSLLARIYPFLS